MIGWLALAGGLLVIGIGVRLVYARRNVRAATCPRTGDRVRLRVVAAPVTEWITDVTECSALGSSGVTCGKSCVQSSAR